MEKQVDFERENLDLNFTHRNAYGGGDDADVAHGDLSQLAKQQLEVLKQKYSSVF